MSVLSPGESGKRLRPILRVLLEKVFALRGQMSQRSSASGGFHVQTPKKTYKRCDGAGSSCCRLCKSTGEIHFKNLFAKGNRALLSAAEEICCQSLRNDNELPHLLCRPCERRLKSFMEFKAKIMETQASFERVKRCIEVSPSVPRTSSKNARDFQSSRRRGLNFALNAGKENIQVNFKCNL